MFPVKPPGLAHLEADLEALRVRDQLRERPAPLPPGAVSFSTNDYLGLAGSTEIERAALGAGASRLVAGEREAHTALEGLVASWLQTEAALVFSSGYAANVGLVAALVGPGDLVVSDALNHASLIDGIRLSRARVVVTPHLDAKAVARALAERSERRAWIVTESYFGMDADTAPLAQLRESADRYGAGLLIDEAHALGVLGPEGRGLAAQAGIVPDALMGTFGKSFGSQGAFVAGSSLLIRWLWNRARSFVFSTGISPLLAVAAKTQLERALAEPWRRERVLAHATRLRNGLAGAGYPVGDTVGPIVPWILGSERAALAAQDRLREQGLHAVAIRPPTVPEGTSRIRLAASAAQSEAEIDRLVLAIGGTSDLDKRTNDGTTGRRNDGTTE
ncbi:8-amino-7-oxononanoate synthase [soil metagenome]